MAKGKKYELAAAYVRIIPSLEGISEALDDALKKMPKAKIPKKVTESIGKDVKNSIDGAVEETDWSGMARGFRSSAGKIVAPLNNAIATALRGSGALLSDTLISGAKVAGAGIATALGLVGTQIAAGGLNRALGLNEAESGLKAMGFEGKQFENIMKAASAAVDGTAYAMNQSVQAARGFLSAGVPEDKLQSYLQNIGKLADMGIRSYDDISVMLQSMAATGRIYGGDLLQLAQAGIPIYTALADSMGVATEEIKNLASDGAIGFDDLNKAIENIDWDSALFASKDVASSFGNMRTALSKTGAELWAPIIDGLPSIFNKAKEFISTFNKVFDFNPIQVRLAATMAKIDGLFDKFSSDDGSLDTNLIKNFVDSNLKEIKKLAEGLEKYRPIIIGTVLGAAGGILSSIPVIGPVFAGLTPVVGAFAAILLSAYDNSTGLQKAIGDLAGDFKTLFNNIKNGSSNFDPSDLFGRVGDGLGVAVQWVREFSGSFLEQMSKNLPQISKSLENMFKSIGEIFSGTEGITGKGLAQFLTEMTEIFSSYFPVLVSVVAEVAKASAEIVTSDGFKSVISFITDVLGFIAENEGLIKAGLIAAAAIFVGGKIISVFQTLSAAWTGISSFIGVFNKAKVGDAAATAAKATGTTASSLKGFLAGFAKIAIVVAAVVAAMAGLGMLMENTGFMYYVNVFITELASGIVTLVGSIGWIIDALITPIESIIGLVVDTIAYLIDSLISAFLNPIGDFAVKMIPVIDSLAEAGAKLLPALGLFLLDGVEFTSELGNFLKTLAEDGVAAGAGAFAAAGGIAALMSSVSGGNLLDSLSNAGGKFLSGLTGADSGLSLDGLTQLMDNLVKLNDLTVSYPVIFNRALEQALVFGMGLPTKIAEGINLTSNLIAIALTSALQAALLNQQVWLDSNPLIVRTQLDNSGINAGGSGSNGYGGSGRNNSYNSTYNLNSSNDSVIRKLLNNGRGY